MKPANVLPSTCILLQRVEDLSCLRNSSRNFELKLSQLPFSDGLPGSV